MQNAKLNTKGVSLPMVIGLVALLMISSMAINEMIIRSMRSIRRIEASNRAYLAAEAGIEDALYELSEHFAGYQTNNVRSTDFAPAGTITDWNNEWRVISTTSCDTLNPQCDSAFEDPSGVWHWGWYNAGDPACQWCGKFYANQKLIVSLFNDSNDNSVITATDDSVINETAIADDIVALDVSSNFSITFKIPRPDNIFPNASALRIDNDGDFDGTDGTINEDGPDDESFGCLENPEDFDCDGLVDEDSDEDPVILWRLTDGGARSLIPIRGCLIDGVGSEICEKDFTTDLSPQYEVTLDQSHSGLNENGVIQTIGTFISDVVATDSHAQLHFEFLIIAPMEHVTGENPPRRNEIPYLAYKVKTSASAPTDIDLIPYPYFEINSDGYYGTFKQSVTTLVTPKTTVPLFDFTIIQQK